MADHRCAYGNAELARPTWQISRYMLDDCRRKAFLQYVCANELSDAMIYYIAFRNLCEDKGAQLPFYEPMLAGHVFEVMQCPQTRCACKMVENSVV